MSLQLSSPQPLGAAHSLDDFGCGEAVLDEWLKRRAQANQLSGASRTFVVADPDQRVFGSRRWRRARPRTKPPPAP